MTEAATDKGDSKAIRSLEVLVKRNPSAANYRRLAEAYERAGRFEDAAQAYFKEAAIYRKKGDPNAARIEYLKGSALASKVKIYLENSSGQVPVGFFTDAKFEPEYGAYLGAFVDKDQQIQTGRQLDWRDVGDKNQFAYLTGKAHASYFNYFRYGQPFPRAWVEHLKEVGAVPQIAWELGPNSLDQVNDDAYLRNFARRAREAGIPIFLRFAGEMNGAWTNYGPPGQYKEKFRLVHNVMEQEAPNVAMVWAPNCIPEENLTAYYPGDQYVDWVGVSMYTVHHHDNDPSRPGEREDPTDNLRYIYNLYSKKKPIMIAEHAVTHYCMVENVEVESFAIDKIRYLYGTLPRLFPRVKMISWYDSNNLINARPGRRLNNYCLTDNSNVLSAYSQAIASPYYLSRVVWDTQEEKPPVLEEIREGRIVKGNIQLSAWVKTYVSRPLIVYSLDGKELKRTNAIPYNFALNTCQLSNGKHTLKMTVYDQKNRVAIFKQLVFTVKN